MKEIVNTELSVEKKKLLFNLIGSKLLYIYNSEVTSLLSGKYEDMENHGFLLEFKSK